MSHDGGHVTPSRVPEVTCERGFSIEPDLRVDPHKKLRNQARIHIRQYDIFEFFFFHSSHFFAIRRFHELKYAMHFGLTVGHSV